MVSTRKDKPKRMKAIIPFILLLLVCSTQQTCAQDQSPQTTVRCLETKDAITVKLGDKPVLRYNKAVRKSPAGIDAVYRRSGYIHPVYTPEGKEITGDFPADHPHQHALFFPWTSTTFEGRDINFWDQKAGTARVSHSKVVSVENGKDFGQFVVELLHEELTAPGGPKPVLRETWSVRVYNTSNDTFLFDIQSEQRCASSSPLTLNKYHYGGMSIRGTDQWFNRSASSAYGAWVKKLKTDPDAAAPGIDVMKHDFLTSEGEHQYAGNHSRPRWVDMFGPIDGTTAGIAVLCHPKNFRAPQSVRLHPHKPYFCFAPMVSGEFQIKPGESYVSRYRYVVHSGEPDVRAIDAEWGRFAK